MRRLAPSSAAIPPAAEIKSGRFWAGSGQLVRHFDRRISSSAGPATKCTSGKTGQKEAGVEPGRVQPLPGRHQYPSALGSGGQVPLQKELIVRKKEKKKAFYALLRTSLRNPLLAKAQRRIPNRRLWRVPIARLQISTSATVSVPKGTARLRSAHRSGVWSARPSC